jgi:hypothetical protein
VPQIRHIARFTRQETPILQSTNEKETTPVRTRTRRLPEKLREIVDKRTEEHKTTIELIYLYLEETTQPLTVIEVAALTEQKLGKKVDPNLARLYLQELEKQGKVSRRLETTEERRLRANGQKARALHAQLWWAPAGEVPARTITEAVPGIILSDKSGRQPGKKNKKIESVEIVEVVTPTPQSPVIDYLVNKLVEERTRSIQDELTATKEELDHLRKNLKSLVGDL